MNPGDVFTEIPPRLVGAMEDIRRANGPATRGRVAALEQFLKTGSPELLAGIRGGGDWNDVSRLADELNRPDAMDELDRRMLRAMLAACEPHHAVAYALQSILLKERPGDDLTAATKVVFESLGVSGEVFERGIVGGVPVFIPARLNSTTRYLLSLPAERLERLVRVAAGRAIWNLTDLFLKEAPWRAAPVVLEARARLGATFELCAHLVESGAPEMVALAERFASEIPEPHGRYLALRALASVDRGKFGPQAVAAASAQLIAEDDPEYMDWVLSNFGAEMVPALTVYVSRKTGSSWDDTQRVELLKLAVKEMGAASKPVLIGAAENGAPLVRLAAVEHLAALNDPILEPLVLKTLEEGLAGPAAAVAGFIKLAGKLQPAAFREHFWKLAVRKQKQVREAAAEALAAGDPGVLDRAAGLLAEKKKDTRLGGVLVLAKLATPAATECLLHWLTREEDDVLRDATYRALRANGVGLDEIVKHFGAADLDELHRRAATITKYPVDWLEPMGAAGPQFPEIKLLDGSIMTPDLVRYLLHRQSRQDEPMPDPQATVLYGIIDRRASGNFAHWLLSAMLDAGPDPADAWVLIAAGLLGDNRVVTALSARIRKWADDSEKKLGMWGIEALAQNGSDAALLAIDALARKYQGSPRRKHAVIGDAAAEAIALAAKRLGISMDELGERTIPSLGFEPGRPRLVEAGKRVIEATIGLDFKLAMKDAATGKRAVSIPKTAAPEVQAEFKGIGKLLQEIAKSQAARLEGLMVRQHRWPVDRWSTLYMQQPLLFPFAVRLVWGMFDANDKLVSTFRALPDRTLTDAQDEPVDGFCGAAAIGIVHPLELDAGQIAAWRTQVSDYEIEQPFEQIDRRVVRVTGDQGDLLAFTALKGATLNAMSFRGKSERTGWARGLAGDGGRIAACQRHFPAAGINAFVLVDGLTAWTDLTATATLGEVLFLPADITPREFQARRIKLGDVPAMVFSEAIGDLMRIAGRGEAQDEGTQGEVEKTSG